MVVCLSLLGLRITGDLNQKMNGWIKPSLDTVFIF